jgi:O-antigen ligase
VIDSRVTGAVPPFGVVICLMMVPLVMVFGLGLGLSLTPLMAAAYALQLGILILYFATSTTQLSPKYAAVLVLFSLSQCCTLVGALLTFGTVNEFDLVNTVCKLLGFLFLVGLTAGSGFKWESLDALFRLIVALSVVALIVGMLKLGELPTLSMLGSSYEVSFQGFFGNRNQLGAFLYVAIVSHFLYRARHNWSLIGVLILAAQLAGLLLTMSRGALLATGLFLLGQLLLRRNLVLGLYGAAGVALTIMAVLSVPHPATSEVRRILIREDAGLSGRDLIWAHGLDVFQLNPLFGVGSFRAIELAQNEGMAQSQFHSFYIETLAAGGIAELAIVGGLLLVAFLRCFRLSSLDHGRVYTSAFLGLFVLMSIGYVDTLFTVMFLSIPLALFGQAPELRKKEARGLGFARHGLAGW